MCQRAAAAKEKAVDLLDQAARTESALERQGILREAVNAILEAAAKQAPAETEHAGRVRELLEQRGNLGRLHDGAPEETDAERIKRIAHDPDPRD